MRQLSTMQPARRVALVAVLALIAGLALAGCRSESSVAAYVGDRRYTHAEVDELAQEGMEKISPDRGVVRQTVLSWLVLRDVGQREARERNLEVQGIDPAEVEQSAQLRAGSPLAKLFVEAVAVVAAFEGTVTPIEPTEADQREVYESLTVNGQPIPNPFDEVRPFLTKESIGRPLALRTVFTDMLAAAKVTVNPRYAPLRYPVQVRVGQVTGFVSLPLGRDSVVSDRG
jgi:hypothetical protein